MKDDIISIEAQALMFSHIVAGLLASGHYTMNEQFIKTGSNHCKAMIDGADILAEILDDITESMI